AEGNVTETTIGFLADDEIGTDRPRRQPPHMTEEGRNVHALDVVDDAVETLAANGEGDHGSAVARATAEVSRNDCTVGREGSHAQNRADCVSEVRFSGIARRTHALYVGCGDVAERARDRLLPWLSVVAFEDQHRRRARLRPQCDRSRAAPPTHRGTRR